MAWYGGQPLLAHLETIELDHCSGMPKDFRMPVQWVNRAHPEFYGLSGRIASGTIEPGDGERILPSGSN